MEPTRRRFRLVARVSSDSPSAIKPILQRVVGERGEVKPIGGGFEIRGEFEGESARELNRQLLSEMRRVEKKTRIRAEWTSGKTVEKFFDYVPKGTRKLQQE
jgi:hypothetical protein